MDARHRERAEHLRARIERGEHDATAFLAELRSVPTASRDAWVDVVLDLRELPDDGPELPRGCVPYIPCPVDTLLRIVEHAHVRASDVFVDVGAGIGRAAALVHLLTGASVIAVEIQSELVGAARDLVARLSLSRVACVQGDAAELSRVLSVGTVFFLYCPFSGERLTRVLADLEDVARTRTIRICTVDLPLPPCSWLSLEAEPSGDLAIYRSTLVDTPLPLVCSDCVPPQELP